MNAESLVVRGGVRSDRLSHYVTLTKPRIVLLVVITALLGYSMGGGALLSEPVTLLAALLGTALVAGGANAINMVQEREFDALMIRTKRRPLPAGLLDPDRALAFSVACAVAGVVVLAILVNALTAILGAVAVALYVLVYTPLKRRTHLSLLAGAVPGALPPVMGWTAAHGSLGAPASVLFGILFLWQIPHFLAIAWMHREDYARGGFPMLPVVEPDGARTARQAVLGALALLAVSLTPFSLGFAGGLYVLGALVLGLLFVGSTLSFALAKGKRDARAVFLASIVYLPLLLSLLALGRGE